MQSTSWETLDCIVHGVTKSQTQLSDFHFQFQSVYKLNKQDGVIQPWCTPFSIWNQSVVPCTVLTVAPWSAHVSWELGRVVVYSHLFKNFPQFVVIHTIQDFSIVNEAEVNVFLEFSCYFYDPVDVHNMISVSSAFSNSSLNIWEFPVHILLKPSLEILSIILLVCEMSAIVQ